MKKLHTEQEGLPYWLLAVDQIIGREGEDDSGSDDSSDDSLDDAGDGTDDDDTPEDELHDDADDPKVKGLKSALATERKSNKINSREVRRLQRELKKAQEAQEERELREKSEVEQAQAREKRAQEKAERLAQGLLKREINAAIEKAAREANFIDVDDALGGVDLSKIKYEQDEDDPSDIEVDFKSVQAEVKGLAARKKHLIKSGTEDGEATGSSFAGGSKKKSGDKDLKEIYPALR